MVVLGGGGADDVVLGAGAALVCGVAVVWVCVVVVAAGVVLAAWTGARTVNVVVARAPRTLTTRWWWPGLRLCSVRRTPPWRGRPPSRT